MTTTIFHDFAPSYWAAGLPVIPLKVRQKAPALRGWTTYCSTMPSAEEQAEWLKNHPRANIGLPLGPASGLCAIDIDTTDPDLVATIEECLPHSPWERVGQKGCALLFRWQDQPGFKISGPDGMIVELLANGNQLVLPPSIHPDTGQPYRANTNLWEVIEKIPLLDKSIEQGLRAAIGGKCRISMTAPGRSRPLDVVPAGERDIQLVRHAGYLARVVRGIDQSSRYSLSEAIEQMHTWVSDFTSKVPGDEIDPEKGVDKLLEFVLKDIAAESPLPDGWDSGLSETQLASPVIAAIAAKNAADRWTYARARDWISDHVALKPDDTDWAINKISDLVELVGRDWNFTEATFEALIPHLRSLIPGSSITRAYLSGLFKKYRAARMREKAEDQEKIARIALEEMNRGGETRFHQGNFWQWNGSCFEQTDFDSVYRTVATGVKGNMLAKRDGDYRAICNVMSKLCAKPLAEHTWTGVNFANGFLDEGLRLHAHSPAFGRSFTMSCSYDAAAAKSQTTDWLALLETAWGSDDDYPQKLNALQEAIAATMFGIAPQYQRAILLYGPGATGKSQVLEIVKAMMPPASVATLPPDQWGERFALTSLVGKTLNVCGELPEAAMIAGDRFKSLVCGEIQSTEYKGRDRFHFEPQAAHWFASNHLPRTKDSSDGFSRRWLILEFKRPIPVADRIVNLHQKVLESSRAGIAAWAAEGMQRLREQGGYTLPQSHERLTHQLRRANNSVLAFLESSDKVRPETGGIADARTVFDAYIYYMREVSRGSGVSYEQFKIMLQGLGYLVETYRDEMAITRDRVVGLKTSFLLIPRP